MPRLEAAGQIAVVAADAEQGRACVDSLRLRDQDHVVLTPASADRARGQRYAAVIWVDGWDENPASDQLATYVRLGAR